jgi:hypothetical protein
VSVALGQSPGNESQASSGSIYSKLGVGFPVDISNTSARSAGLLGVSYNESYVGSLANPAIWGSTVYGLGSGGLNLQSFSASENDISVTNSDFSFNQFQLQLPITRGEFGISGSFSPISRSNFHTLRQSSRIINRGGGLDTLQYSIKNTGSGGVNRAELGFGWRINEYISIGYAASAVLVSQDDEYTGTFNNVGFRRVNYSYETSGVGLGNRFGALIRIPDLFNDNDQLGVGATVDLPVNIDASQQKSADEVVQTTDPINLGEGTIRMPMKISGGLSYRPNNLLLFGAEGFFHRWSNYRNDFGSPSPQSGVNFVDRYKLGLGMKYFPYLSDSNNFLSNFKYRLGTSYDTGHLRIDGESINTLMFSFGFGIRSPNSNSSIDLGFEYGMRGTDSGNLVKEQIWGVRLSVNLSEIMFFRPRLQ